MIWIILLIALLSAIGYVVFTPYPIAYLVRKLFENPPATLPDNYQTYLDNTIKQSNLTYPSLYPSNQFDLIMPKQVPHPLPVIVWVHGGAYVGGDKKDADSYLTQLVSHGYIGINMNYQRAPESRYPTPLYQIDEMLTHLDVLAASYPLNPRQIILAGDSAGAQLVSQYLTALNNLNYAQSNHFSFNNAISNVKACILFCGPYHIKRLLDLSRNPIIKWSINQIGFAYLNNRYWHNSEQIDQADIFPYLTNNFPPSFISDGNMLSFTQDGIALATSLKTLGVTVVDVFYEGATLYHEYQFKMDTIYGEKTMNNLVSFLKTIIKPSK